MEIKWNDYSKKIHKPAGFKFCAHVLMERPSGFRTNLLRKFSGMTKNYFSFAGSFAAHKSRHAKNGGKTCADCNCPANAGMGTNNGRCANNLLVVLASDPSWRFLPVPTNFVFSKYFQ